MKEFATVIEEKMFKKEGKMSKTISRKMLNKDLLSPMIKKNNAEPNSATNKSINKLQNSASNKKNLNFKREKSPTFQSFKPGRTSCATIRKSAGSTLSLKQSKQLVGRLTITVPLNKT